MNKESFWQHWKRRMARQYIRVVAERSSEHRIALGAALGLFIGMLIPMSMQLIIVLPLAFAFHASKIAAATFTFVTNPVSVVFIYPVQVMFGYYVLNFEVLSQEKTTKIIQEIVGIFSLERWTELFTFTWWGDMAGKFWSMLSGTGLTDIVLPFFTGGFLFGVALAVPGYFIMLHAVRRYQKMRHNRRCARRSRTLASKNEAGR